MSKEMVASWGSGRADAGLLLGVLAPLPGSLKPGLRHALCYSAQEPVAFCVIGRCLWPSVI